MAELRYDPVRRHWVIIAGDRAKRPSDFDVRADIGSPETCPFCPGHEHETPTAIQTFPSAAHYNSNWQWRLIPNRFAALSSSAIARTNHSELHESIPAKGEHEVLIECREHARRLADFSVEEIAHVLAVYQSRIRQHAANGYPYVAIFRNVGFRGGATLSHPHSQILAMPVIPPALQTELDSTAAYREKHDRCIFCDLVQRERNDNQRIVFEDDGFIVMAPFASRFAYELLILPHHHDSDFSKISGVALEGISRVLKATIMALDLTLHSPDYNLILHSVPNVKSEQFHWHFEILPRLAFQAGFEWGTAIHIVSTAPEEAAKRLSKKWQNL